MSVGSFAAVTETAVAAAALVETAIVAVVKFALWTVTAQFRYGTASVRMLARRIEIMSAAVENFIRLLESMMESSEW